jgi:hypothetical protein
MNTIMAVLWLSVGLQILAAVLALRLVSLSGRALGWAVLSAVFLLLALGRAASLLHLADVVPDVLPFTLLAEAVALVISVLSVLGMLLIADVFKRLRRAEERSARQLEELREFQRLTVSRELRAGELAKENERLRAVLAHMARKPGSAAVVGHVVAGNKEAHA